MGHVKHVRLKRATTQAPENLLFPILMESSSETRKLRYASTSTSSLSKHTRMLLGLSWSCGHHRWTHAHC